MCLFFFFGCLTKRPCKRDGVNYGRVSILYSTRCCDIRWLICYFISAWLTENGLTCFKGGGLYLRAYSLYSAKWTKLSYPYHRPSRIQCALFLMEPVPVEKFTCKGDDHSIINYKIIYAVTSHSVKFSTNFILNGVYSFTHGRVYLHT